MPKLDKFQDTLKPFTEASKLGNWKVNFTNLLTLHGLEYVLLTRKQMEIKVSLYGPDEGSESDEEYEYVPFEVTEPEEPTHPSILPFDSNILTTPLHSERPITPPSPEEGEAANLSTSTPARPPTPAAPRLSAEQITQAKNKYMERYFNSMLNYEKELDEYKVKYEKWVEDSRQWDADQKEMEERMKVRKRTVKRHRRDKQPTVIEWEEMNKKMCAALFLCVPVSVRDYTQGCLFVSQILAEMDSRYLIRGPLADLAHREKYKEYAFTHTKPPVDQFGSLEHIEHLANVDGVKFNQVEKATQLLSRLDTQWKTYITFIAASRPGLTEDYERMKQVLLEKWAGDMALHLHGDKKDNRESTTPGETALYSHDKYLNKGSKGKGKGSEKNSKNISRGYDRKGENNNNNNNNAKGYPRLRCYNCNSPTHRAQECTKPLSQYAKLRIEADTVRPSWNSTHPKPATTPAAATAAMALTLPDNEDAPATATVRAKPAPARRMVAGRPFVGLTAELLPKNNLLSDFASSFCSLNSYSQDLDCNIEYHDDMGILGGVIGWDGLNMDVSPPISPSYNVSTTTQLLNAPDHLILSCTHTLNPVMLMSFKCPPSVDEPPIALARQAGDPLRRPPIALVGQVMSSVPSSEKDIPPSEMYSAPVNLSDQGEDQMSFPGNDTTSNSYNGADVIDWSPIGCKTPGGLPKFDHFPLPTAGIEKNTEVLCSFEQHAPGGLPKSGYFPLPSPGIEKSTSVLGCFEQHAPEGLPKFTHSASGLQCEVLEVFPPTALPGDARIAVCSVTTETGLYGDSNKIYLEGNTTCASFALHGLRADHSTLPTRHLEESYSGLTVGDSVNYIPVQLFDFAPHEAKYLLLPGYRQDEEP